MTTRLAAGWKVGVRIALTLLLLAIAPTVLLAHSGPTDPSYHAKHPLAAELPSDGFDIATESSDEIGPDHVLVDATHTVAVCVVPLVDDERAPRRTPVFPHVTPRRGPPRL